jgi:hypothetical protein
VFDPGNPFLTSLMFGNKAKGGLTHKHFTWLLSFAMNQHISLVARSVCNQEGSFVTLIPGVNLIKLLLFLLMLQMNKLECLTLAILSGQV